MRVRQAATRTKGEVHVGVPKTPAGVRDVGIAPHLIPNLAKCVAALPLVGMTGAATAELKAMMGHATAGMVGLILLVRPEDVGVMRRLFWLG